MLPASFAQIIGVQTMNIKLIGWPSAGGRGSWENFGAASVAQSRGGGGVSSVVVTLHTMAKVGDITGGGAGDGRTARLRRARARTQTWNARQRRRNWRSVRPGWKS